MAGTIIRSPRITIEVEQWNWDEGRTTSRRPMDITPYAQSYSFTKSIKTPEASGTVSLFPQMGAEHLLSVLNPMDVITIREFGITKFVGYIESMHFAGSIGQDGKPQRTGTIQFLSFSSIITQASIGLNLGLIQGRADLLVQASIELAERITNAVESNNSPVQVIRTVLDSWFLLLDEILPQGSRYRRYIDAHFDYSNLVDFGEGAFPRQFQLFDGTEEEITVWQVLSQLIEQPFFEIWADCGPRTVTVDSTEMTLPDRRDHLVVRPTPFNGTVDLVTGATIDRFERLPSKQVNRDNLISFSVGRNAQEAYSAFTAIPATFDLGNTLRVLAGDTVFSERNLNRYLYRHYTSQLWWIRSTENNGDSQGDIREISSSARRGAETLRNWFELSDQFLNGSIRILVPQEAQEDIYIGERVNLEGIQGFMYVEGVSHEWSYGGPITSNLSITRWENRGQPVNLADRIFRRQVVTGQ